ncbi:hypothetical protein BW897_30150 [Bacillus cereus]|uniref:Uncharacterized protein n=1 Tax=Bacillus cereus TaxID=1396 RepID=A0A1S9TD55_BACCE|nr:hypothetical protein [Bacillus cereus]OOR07659.1 hypothetical protein BW897_30150 [Bacillus cereus]
MGRSKSMRDAYYRSYANPSNRTEVNCHDVTKDMKNNGTFYCMECEAQVVHAGGESPYYRLPSKDAEHDKDCDNYLPVDDTSERIRKLGKKLKVQLKPPSFHDKEKRSNDKAGIKDKKVQSKIVNPVKSGRVKTIEDANKTKTITLNSAADLLYHTSFDRPEEHRKNVTRELLQNKQLYYRGTYDALQKDFEEKLVSPIVFIKGRLHKKQFFTFDKYGYFDIQDHYKDYGPIELRVDLNGVPELEKRFKKLTWFIRSGRQSTEVVGVMGKVIGVEEKEDKTFIHIRCYDIDVEPKDQ